MHNRNQRKKSKFFKEAIKRLNHKLNYDFFEERKQGFQVQEVMKSALDLIRRQTQKLNPKSFHQRQLSSEDGETEGQKIETELKRVSLQKKRKTALLPELIQYINEKNAQSNNELIKFQRRKIIHLLILGINRRSVEKTKEGFDIILLASSYLNKDKQQYSLQINSLNLIVKFYRQYQKKIKSKNLQYEKHRKSMMLKNIACESNFIDNFMLKFRKTKLIKEVSFSLAKKNNSLNYVRINAKFSAYIPEAVEIFGQQYPNYDFVAITIDDKNNLFPYEYPKSVYQHISKQQYRQIICKLNGILFVQRQCYDWNSILKLYFVDFLIIFLSFSIYIMLGMFGSSESVKTAFFTLFLICFVVVSIHMTGNEKPFKSYIHVHERIQTYLIKLQEYYKQKQLKFRLSEGNIGVFIVIPLLSQSVSSSISEDSMCESSSSHSPKVIKEQKNESLVFENNSESFQKQDTEKMCQDAFQSEDVPDPQKLEMFYEIFVPTFIHNKDNESKDDQFTMSLG